MATLYIGEASASPIPLDVLLGTIPSLPRPILSRLTARMIDRLDELDGDPDLEEDDPPGGNVEDEGENESAEGGAYVCHYGLDQRIAASPHGTIDVDREAWRPA